MAHDTFYVISGLWSIYTNTPLEFLESIGCRKISEDAFQLRQTFSECRLERFDRDVDLQFDKLEQYRAFSQGWELWIRNINSRKFVFRFMCKDCFWPPSAIDTLKEKGFSDVSASELQNRKILRQYPLWGKPMAAKSGQDLNEDCWYTARIPQILMYPVDFPDDPEDKRVFLKVEEFTSPDGAVDLVRYCGLAVRALEVKE
jgi:hypothetical protein